MPAGRDRLFYLDVGGAPVFCRLQPATAPPSGHAVLMVPPFGWEDVCSYRPRRAWAHHLAERGTPVLRFDLPGAGDSAGGPHDAGLVGAWTDATVAAAAWLAGAHPEARLTLIGVGLGGLLAWRALAAGAPADDLVLWGAAARGKSLVREMKAFSRLERSRLAELNPGRELPTEPAGSLAAAGFVLSAETVADLSAVDLGEEPLPDASARRALVLGRDGVAADAALVAAAERQGLQITNGDGEGWGAMCDEPSLAHAPHATIAAVDAWLADAPAHRLPRAERPAPATLETATLDAGDGPVRETPVRFDGIDGIRAEPVDGTADTGLTLLLLNAGSIRRIGPNRMWVEAARRWAARGVTTLRLDFDGIGEADGPENFADEPFRYSSDPVFGRRALAVIEALATQDPTRRFLSGGLCSGAYWSACAARDDPRVRAIYLINPRTLVWDPRLIEARDARKLSLLGRASTYRRVLRGDIPLRRGLEIVRALLGRLAGFIRGLPGRFRARQRPAAPVDAVDALLDRLRDQDQRVHLLFTGNEPVYQELERDGQLARLAQWPNVALERVGELGDVHNLPLPAVQRAIHARLDAALAADVAAQREATTSKSPPFSDASARS